MYIVNSRFGSRKVSGYTEYKYTSSLAMSGTLGGSQIPNYAVYVCT